MFGSLDLQNRANCSLLSILSQCPILPSHRRCVMHQFIQERLHLVQIHSSEGDNRILTLPRTDLNSPDSIQRRTDDLQLIFGGDLVDGWQVVRRVQVAPFRNLLEEVIESARQNRE